MKLLIDVERNAPDFRVRLWLLPTQVPDETPFCTDTLQWQQCSRLFEVEKFMTDAELGRIDAYVARKISVLCALTEKSGLPKSLFFSRMSRNPKPKSLVALALT